MKTSKAKVALGLSKKTVAALILFVRNIISKMTGNAYFTTPNPSLSAVTTAIDELEVAEENKKAQGIINRDNKQQVVHTLVNNLGLYVEAIANGNGAIIESAGMPVRKAPEPKTIPGVVRNIKAEDTTEVREVKVSHKGATGADNVYYTEYNMDENLSEKGWVTMPSTGKHYLVITGLDSGRRVFFRVRAKNTAGFGAYSSVATRIVQ